MEGSGVLESEELRRTWLRIESQRDQLEAAWNDCEADSKNIVDEASAAVFIARTKTLKARQIELMKQVADARRRQIQTQVME